MPSNHHYYKENLYMTCVLDVRSSSPRTVKKVLSKCHGLVHSCRMEGGKVEISGTIDPEMVLKGLKRAGSNAKILWLQFGECSSNRFVSGGHTTNYQSVLPSYQPRAAAYVHRHGHPQYSNCYDYSYHHQHYDNYHAQYYQHQRYDDRCVVM